VNVTCSLSLAMFEALRGLRDAVAPESGNLGGEGANTNENELDFDEFWNSWRKGDKVRHGNSYDCVLSFIQCILPASFVRLFFLLWFSIQVNG